MIEADFAAVESQYSTAMEELVLLKEFGSGELKHEVDLISPENNKPDSSKKNPDSGIRIKKLSLASPERLRAQSNPAELVDLRNQSEVPSLKKIHQKTASEMNIVKKIRNNAKLSLTD